MLDLATLKQESDAPTAAGRASTRLEAATESRRRPRVRRGAGRSGSCRCARPGGLDAARAVATSTRPAASCSTTQADGSVLASGDRTPTLTTYTRRRADTTLAGHHRRSASKRCPIQSLPEEADPAATPTATSA